MGLFYSLLLILSLCFVNVYSYEYVPVYMWETGKNYSPLPALGRLNEEFKDIVQDKFSKENMILVFLEENLSPEDFTTYDSAGNNVFYALSHMKSEAQVNYYPFVEAPVNAIESVPGLKISTVEVTSDGLPPNTKIEPGHVLIVDLNDANENEDRSHMLSRHDSLIASIYKSVALKNKNIIALYTAKHSSWLVPSELEGNSRKARHLLATEGTKNYFYKDEILLYANFPLVLNASDATDPTKNNINITVEEYKDLSTTTDNNTVTLKATKDASNYISFAFKSELGYWYFTSIEGQNDGKDYKIPVNDIYAPTGFSYHCYDSVFKANYTLNMTGLQVQFNLTNTTTSDLKFGDAYDCVGFTTIPIWSGIFVTFLLAIIMTIGLTMIMDIKTMDRFDDPKGKTISINVVE